MGKPVLTPEQKIGRRAIDITGKIYGRLKVVQFSHIDREYFWKCICECGNEKTVRGHDLRNGHTSSCGCYRIEFKRKANGEAALNELFKRYKADAIERGLIFELTKEQFKILTSQNCSYCNQIPSNILKSRTSGGNYIYNGIDRIDNDIGYTTENCVTCCTFCNYAKHVRSQEEFQQWINQLVSFQNVKKSSD